MTEYQVMGWNVGAGGTCSHDAVLIEYQKTSHEDKRASARAAGGCSRGGRRGSLEARPKVSR